jgi:hypothetical protein
VPGYISGLSEAARPTLPSNAAVSLRDRLKIVLDVLWEKDPVLGFYVMTPSGDFVDSFARAIGGVREKKIPSSFMRTFAAWNGPRHTWPAEARFAAQTLLEIARQGDEDAAETGLEFIAFVLMRTPDSEDRLTWLQKVFQDKSLDVIFGLMEQITLETRNLAHSFSQIFVRVLPANPDRATSLLIQMMQSESYETLDTAAGLFGTVAAVRPQELMDGIGEVMLSKGRPLGFLFRKFPIVSLPESVLLAWLEKHGLEGARILARHLRRPSSGSTGGLI